MNKKIILLVSGNLGEELFKDLLNNTYIACVATDNKSFGIIQLARNNNIPLFIGNPRNGKLLNFLINFPCEILLSINYIFLIEPDVINIIRFPINFHGSLLPKYRGRTPHVWSIINNEAITGITAHLIDEFCDSGDILLQKKIHITYEDTGFSVLKKYINIYPEVVREVLSIIDNNQLVKTPQNSLHATLYGKRTPDDGQINWNWHKERIRNWVRAQAHPYPGAFSFLKGYKLIIDKIKFSEVGFDNSIQNGTVIQINPKIIVKTSNGAVELDTIRKFNLLININDILE